MPTSLETLLESYLLEPIALVAAARRAHEFSDAARERMKPWAAAANLRFRVARDLRDERALPVALGLLREAAFYALCAVCAGRSAEDSLPSSPEEAWQRYDALPGGKQSEPEALAKVRSLLAAKNPLAAEAFERRQAYELRAAGEATVCFLLELCEVRSPRQITRTRVARLAFTALVTALVVVALASYWSALNALSVHGGA
jgi:hypothetical protein